MVIDKPEKTIVSNELPLDINDYVGYYKINPVQFSKFEYLDLLFNSIQIEIESTYLKINSIQNEAYDLLPTGENLFRKEDRINPSHVFYKTKENLLLSDGLLTYEMYNPIYLGLLWLSLVFGLLGIFMILIRGTYKLCRKQLFGSKEAILFPFLVILGLAIPIPFLVNQSFLSLGDFTLANVLLAVSTGLLPTGMIVGLIRSHKSKTSKIDQISILATLQWLAILIIWELIPFRMWS